MLALVPLLAACGGSDGRSTFTATPAASATRTGVPAVDTAVAAVTAGDADALIGMVRYQRAACVTSIDPLNVVDPSPPRCPAGVAPGTPVDAFLTGTCEGGLVTREAAGERVREALSGSPPIFHAAYGLSAVTELPPSMKTDYEVVFALPGETGRSFSLSLGLWRDSIGWMMTGCSSAAERGAVLEQLGARALPTVAAGPE